MGDGGGVSTLDHTVAGPDRPLVVVAGISWTPLRLRGLRHGLWLGAAFVGLFAFAAVASNGFGMDSHAYWSAWRNGLYSAAPEQRDAYLYSPAFAQGIWPLTLLPWPVFCAGWMLAAAAVYAWLLAPLGRAWALPLFGICGLEIVTGNVWPFFALVLVAGLRFPAAWAFPILLKLTPGVVVLWFVVRREWRSLTIALLTTLVVAVVSFAVAPHLWMEWVRLLLHPGEFANPSRKVLHQPLHFSALVRLAVGIPISIVLTVHAARTNRAYLLPVAVLLSVPVFGFNVFGILTAIPRLLQGSEDKRSSSGAVAVGRGRTRRGSSSGR